MELHTRIRIALRKSMDYAAYREAMARQVREGRTSGLNQDESLVGYTRLNHQRMKRWEKRFRPDEALANKLRDLQSRMVWLVLTESWCGDAAPVLPVMRAFELQSVNLSLRIAARDDHPELMDRFRTDGALAIPKLLVLDADSLEVVGQWGPRPEEPMQMVRAYKAEHGGLSAEFRESLQQWYNTDGGRAIARELEELLALKEVGDSPFLGTSR